MPPRYINDLADVGDDDLGALGLFRRRGRSRRQPQRQMANRQPLSRLIPGIPGVPARGSGDQPLGFGASAFTATSGTLITLTASPQRPFRGRRLVVDITRTGTTSTGLVTITRLDVGADNQLPGAGAIGAAAFGATAVGVNLDMDPATPGVTITIQLNISAAPTTTDRVDFNATLIGEVVR